ncbi:MAG: prepilin-type N-terminal cleavage/methylation domain-containing protein [Polyangiales bacterium]
MTRRNAGFTLIELMLAVAIIGVLAAIGMPTYVRYTQKSKRSEAYIALGAIGEAQEIYYEEHHAYAKSFDGLLFDISHHGTRVSANVIQGPIYTYTLSSGDGYDWYVLATSNLDGDAWMDVLTSGRISDQP